MTLGIIALYAPGIISSESVAAGTLGPEITSYGHTKNNFCYSDRADLSFNVSLTQMIDWITNGLNRDITIKNQYGKSVFQGFANKVTVTRLGLSGDAFGPILDIANRVYAVFTPTDYDTDPPTKGVTQPTIIAEDTLSQVKYGIWEKPINAGEVQQSEAEYIRDTFLEDRKDPLNEGDISLPGGETGTISIEILGYMYYLMAYPYFTEAVGYQTLSDKIIAILGADPNGIIPAAYAEISDNLMITNIAETEGTYAFDLIQGIIARGNISADKYVFGLRLGSRRPFYSSIPTTIDYVLNIADGVSSVTNLMGEPVQPWDVEPGKWIFVAGYSPGGEPPLNVRRDFRVKFIEEVSFSSPYGLSLRYGRVDKISQLLAAKGLGGM